MIVRPDIMTREKQKKLIIIGSIVLAVILIVGTIVLLVKKSGKKTDAPVKQAYSRNEEIVGIRFSFWGEENSLVKKRDGWQWEDQPKLGLDQDAISAELEDLGKTLQIDKYADSGELSAYGLKDSQNSLTLKYKNGKETTFVVGGLCGVTNYYASINGEATVYEVSSELMELIDSLAAQRDIGEQMDSEHFSNLDDIEK